MKIVFIHGLGQDSSSWQKTVSFLPKNVSAACPDLFFPGQTESTYKNLYQAFSGYCEGLSRPFHLCGLSLGGILALHYAIQHPENVQSLALIGALHKMPKGLLAFQTAIFYLLPECAFQAMGSSKKLLISLSRSMVNLDYSDSLTDISCATLVLCGEKDKANKQAAKTTAKMIPGACLRFIQNAGHEVNTENPAALASELKSFYQRCSFL